jgi:threonine dehydratase
VRLNSENEPAEIYLKLENLQPTGSFKVRGAGNAISQIPREILQKGVYTVSAGNMAQALAWHAQRLGVPCTVIVHDDAPRTKLEAIKRYGAETIPLPFEKAWEIATTGHYPPLEEKTFIHPFANRNMIIGNGTTGLEIIEDLPEVETVVIPFGGGGLSAGIASAIKSKKPETHIYACEPETAAPLAASFAAGSAQKFPKVQSFVDGIGASSVLPVMWELVNPLLDGSLVMSLHEIATAIKLLVERNRVVAEGAGGASVAAARSGKAGNGKIVCVVSGGNIDTEKLGKILHGEVP